MSRSVIVAAGGADWESDVLDEIRRSESLQLHRRCLDAADVLALAPHCDVAVLSTDLAGLDTDTVLALERDRVRVLGVGDAERGQRLGIATMIRPGGIESSLQDPVRVDAPSQGAVIVVWGPHGAPGRSVVAASLAAAWAAAGQRVTLVDADARGGALAQMFALLDDVSGLVAACRSANHGDLHEIGGHTADVEPGLRLLSGVPRADMWAQVREGPFQVVVRNVAQASDVVVVDVGPTIDAQVGHLLSVAERVVVVGRADPVGLARLVRALHDLQAFNSTPRRSASS